MLGNDSDEIRSKAARAIVLAGRMFDASISDRIDEVGEKVVASRAK